MLFISLIIFEILILSVLKLGYNVLIYMRISKLENDCFERKLVIEEDYVELNI